MIKTRILKILLVASLIVLLLLGILAFNYIKAADPVSTVITDTTMIVFDLAKGNISIGSTYSGMGYKFNEETGEWDELSSISGTHDAENQYYVFQSNGDTYKATIDGDKLVLPAYADIDDEIFNNNTNINYVIEKWQEEAEKAGRADVDKRIEISVSGTTCNVTIENIWSTFQKATINNVGSSGFVITGAETSNTIINLYLKGDNRLGSLRYYTGSSKSSQLNINSATQNASTEGSLVVIGRQDGQGSNSNYRFYNGSGYVSGKVCSNHWDSVIGGTDNKNNVRGLNILGGTVYAGASKWENCTAIGGGGNGVAEVTISGGFVTAVASTTGTAIGGGIAHLSSGGPGYVTITGGTVYAYNFGQPFAENLSSTGQTNLNKETGQYGVFVPGTAIGGGGSALMNGSLGEITISGEDTYVYAYSYGGSGIGGGNTVGNLNTSTHVGGKAIVNISGGRVISISDSVQINTTSSLDVAVNQLIPAGTGIGGGTSVNQNGGEGIITISGGRITANGIGGGGSTLKNGGDATVTISGGTTIADNIGGGYSETLGYASGEVTITGGSLKSKLAITPTNGTEPVFITNIGTTDMNNNAYLETLVTDVKFSNSLEYGLKDVYTDEEGAIYLWIPESEAIEAITIDEQLLGAYDEPDLEINSASMGIVRPEEAKRRYLLNILTSKFYQTYLDEAKESPFDGLAFVEENTYFTFYIQSALDEYGEYYTIQPYTAVEDANGNKSFQMDSIESPIGDGFYRKVEPINGNTQIWFEITDSKGEKMFIMDLSIGNIIITEDETKGVVIEQNGYKLYSYEGEVYVSSGGYPTTKTITVDAGDEAVKMYMDSITASSQESIITVNSGTLELSFGVEDNSTSSYSSNTSSAITVKENATLIINAEEGASLKLDGAPGYPAISGNGTLILNDNGGHLKLNTGQDKAENTSSQIAIGTYVYNGETADYTANLKQGEYTFELVGYINNNVFYGKDTITDANTEDFSARGIVVVYSKETIKRDSIDVVDGDLQIDLSVVSGYTFEEEIKVVRADTDEVLTSGYSWDVENGLITIKGNSFIAGNLIIYVYTDGVISYQDFDVTKEYDGSSYGIELIVDTTKFDVYYSTEELTSKPTDETLNGNPIKISDVGTKTVYFYITQKDANGDYEDAYGSATVTITQALNLWREDLICSDMVLGSILETGKNPKAVSKFGTVEYEFYTDREATDPIEIDEIGDVEGEFYVKAFVPAMKSSVDPSKNNYEAIDSGTPIKFKVYKTSVFAVGYKSLEKINSPDTVVEASANGAFTVYYQTAYSSDVTISVDKELAIGTRITLIDFTDGSNMFYYHAVEAEDIVDGKTVISLTKFHIMGVESVKFSRSANAAELQFCFEATNEDFTDNTVVTLTGMEGVTVSTYTRSNTKFDNYVTEVDGTGIAYVPVKITSTGVAVVGSGYLAVQIDKINSGMNVMLKDGNNKYAPVHAVAGLFVFDLGQADRTGEEYELMLSGIDQSVTLSIHTCIISAGNDLRYPLANRNLSNHMTVTVTYTQEQSIYAEIVGSGIISADSEYIDFNLSYADGSVPEQAVAYLYSCTVNGESMISILDVEKINNETSAVSRALLTEKLRAGSYKIVFDVNGKTAEAYFIVN